MGLSKEHPRVLIGTVGYHNLCNHSVGPILLPELQSISWPPGSAVEELNWGPIAIVQRLQSEKKPFERVVLLSAVEREGRQTGDISIFRWLGGLPGDDQIQACIGDAVTGVISVENLLVIGEHFKAWPEEVFLVDVEPGPEKTGPTLTPEVARKEPEILDIMTRLGRKGSAPRWPVRHLFGNLIMQ
ncbi:MAG: hypothetical protein R3350_06485 [Saprospiraceae bacterium]|nr:hypothetical protein [Saprospiraceae bacterium]